MKKRFYSFEYYKYFIYLKVIYNIFINERYKIKQITKVRSRFD